MKIYKKRCNQCLFTKNKVVGNARKKEVINNCLKNDSYFICHKSEDTCCKGFWDNYKNDITILRVINMLGQGGEFIEHEQ